MRGDRIEIECLDSPCRSIFIVAGSAPTNMWPRRILEIRKKNKQKKPGKKRYEKEGKARVPEVQLRMLFIGLGQFNCGIRASHRSLSFVLAAPRVEFYPPTAGSPHEDLHPARSIRCILRLDGDNSDDGGAKANTDSPYNSRTNGDLGSNRPGLGLAGVRSLIHPSGEVLTYCLPHVGSPLSRAA